MEEIFEIGTVSDETLTGEPGPFEILGREFPD
jgi:hypothetical protein